MGNMICELLRTCYLGVTALADGPGGRAPRSYFLTSESIASGLCVSQDSLGGPYYTFLSMEVVLRAHRGHLND